VENRIDINIENNNGLKKLKILIAEDNKINMLVLKTIIKNMNIDTEMFEAYNGVDFIDKFEATDVDIVFMDIQMPLLNGYEATRSIRNMKNGGNIPIIAITAGAEKDQKIKCIEAGMNDYLSKPISAEIIEKTIIKWMEEPRLK
jgi:CheY-like chemotaxis protein